jgi:hypothetical protein
MKRSHDCNRCLRTRTIGRSPYVTSRNPRRPQARSASKRHLCCRPFCCGRQPFTIQTAFNQPQPIRPKSWVQAHVRHAGAFPQYGIQLLRGLVSRFRHNSQPQQCNLEGLERAHCSLYQSFQLMRHICSLIQPRLLQDRPFGLWVKVHRRVSCDCHGGSL